MSDVLWAVILWWLCYIATIALVVFVGIWRARPRPVRDTDGHWRVARRPRL